MALWRRTKFGGGEPIDLRNATTGRPRAQDTAIIMGETSSSDVTLILKGLKVFTGQKPEEFADWLRKFSLLLSFRRRDMYDIIEGQQRPTADTNTLTTEQAAFDQANKDLYAILFLTTEKPATLLVTKHATDSRGTCGDGQAAMKELESKYLKVTNEYIRATQKALANTEMHLGQDPDEYINEATVLRERLTEMKEPISDRHFMDIILEGLTDTYKDVKLMTWKDPDIDLSKIQSVLRHVYQDEQSRKTGGGRARICHDGYGTREGHHLPQLRDCWTLREGVRHAPYRKPDTPCQQA